MASIREPQLEAWLAFLFDRPVGGDRWYWAPDVVFPQLRPEESLRLAASCFENAEATLRPFSDAQLNVGLWALAESGISSYLTGLSEPSVPSELCERVLESFVPLFRAVMAERCTPTLSHLNENPASPLNEVCYMWWDLLPLYGQPLAPARAAIDARALSVMEQILAIPHDACRESALHGLGHWAARYPSRVSGIVGPLLASGSSLRPELVRYAATLG